MSRIYNFSAGPSVLPEAVLKTAASEMLDFHGHGQSVMEMSHRSQPFEQIMTRCQTLLRELLHIPDDYKVLLLQGGASSQFAMIPLNLMKKNKKADFVITGQWAKKAYAEAQKYGTCSIVASSADQTFSYIPKLDPDTFDPHADYFYICLNNTIYGTKFSEIPDTGSVPLVADISSCILSEPIDVSKFGLLFAGAQKNMGPAGLTVAIVREDLIQGVDSTTPTMFDYAVHDQANSMYNTPPCYAIYVCSLVLEWIKNEMGGMAQMQLHNQNKAKLLYDFLDSSEMFRGTVEPSSRSLMNVPFVTGNDDLDKRFVVQAAECGLVNLKGHRSVGGMRASIYNAMPIQGVQALVDFMRKFEQTHG